MKFLGLREEGKYLFLSMESDPQLLKSVYFSKIDSLSKNVSISGFRKGKAPMPMVISYLKKRGHWDSEINKVLNKVIDKTIEEILSKDKDLDEKVFGLAVGKTVKSLDFDSWILTFEAKFEMFPKVKLGNYSNIPTLIEMQDVNSDFWPVSKNEEIDRNDIVSISMESRDSSGKLVMKYSYDLIEINLETTKIRKEIVDALIGLKNSEKKEIVIKDGEEEVNVKLTVLLVRKKEKINSGITGLLGLPENSTIETIKDFVKKQYEIYNFVIMQKDLIKWLLSDANTIDPVPLENIKMESYKFLKSIKNEEERHYSFKRVFCEQVNQLKSSLVVSEISKKENMEVSETDIGDFERDLTENPWKYGSLNIERFKSLDEETIKNCVLQFKVFKLLSENWKFSN